MQEMDMQLHEQQRRGPVSFQHSSACPYRFSQQSHKSAPTADRMNVSRCIIGHYRWPEYFVNVHEQSPCVTPPRSEGSVASGSEMLRCAEAGQGWPLLVVRHCHVHLTHA